MAAAATIAARPLRVRLAIERARIQRHVASDAVLVGFDRAAAIALDWPPLRASFVRGTLVDALVQYLVTSEDGDTRDDDVAVDALQQLTGGAVRLELS